MDTGDTAFMLIATALVMFMTPGLALFYAGLVRSKNVLEMLMKNLVCLGVVSVIWVLYGYSMAFGTDVMGIVGGSDHLLLKGVGLVPPDGSTIPPLLFCAFQLMFAVITPALITGALAERMKFGSFVLFVILWSTLVYFPVCHWVWGEGGWLYSEGALDFAGGTVIHINSGAAALVVALVLGRRRDHGTDAVHPHNLPMTILGAGILWIGWFGFNAGSALAANQNAVVAFFNTQVAAAAGSLTWILAEWIRLGKPTTLGLVSGALAGLVAVTPAAGFVSPTWGLVIGAVAGFLCYGGVLLKEKLGYDDALDVVAIHGLGGLWGALATGVFAHSAWGSGSGLIQGNYNQVVVQAKGAFATIAYSMVATFVILMVVKVLFGLRVSAEDEDRGLDLTQHSERGYSGL